MDLGEHYPCLNVHDLARSIEFYEKLDFKLIQDHRSENWAVLQHNNMALCLYQGHIDMNLINFRGGRHRRDLQGSDRPRARVREARPDSSRRVMERHDPRPRRQLHLLQYVP